MTIAAPPVAPPAATPSKFDLIQRWATSFPDYARDLLKVQTIEGDLVPLEHNAIQRAVHEILDHIQSQGRLVRVIIDKLRRTGMTTDFAGMSFHEATTKPNFNAMMITHEPAATDFVFGMHKRFLAHLPKPMMPSVLYDNRKVLEFNKKGRRGGLDSSIRVGTAGRENFGSSQLVHFLHGSEVSKWPERIIDPLLASLMPCIPKTPETKVIMESTANGVGNTFYQMYWAARYKYRLHLDADGEVAWSYEVDERAPAGNMWSAIFIPWFTFDKCSMPVASWERQTGLQFELTEEEYKFIGLHLKNVPLAVAKQKLAWRRMALVNDFGGDIKRLAQEYPATDIESFITSGEMVFDTYEVLAAIENAPEPKVKYEMDPKTGQVTFMPEGRLWVWDEPRSGVDYVVVADVAKGIVVESDTDEDSKYDNSVATVKEHLTGVEVAQFMGKCFVSGTQIYTSTGMKNIEDVEVGDLVWTHKNRFRPVIRTISNSYVGDVVTFRAQNNYESITCTPEHPVLSAEVDLRPIGKMKYTAKSGKTRDVIQRKLCFSGVKWRSARDISAICVPRTSYSENVGSINLPAYTKNKILKNVEKGFCHCGCGEKVSIARQQRKAVCGDIFVGKPVFFKSGHGKRATQDRKVPINNALARVIGYYLAEGSLIYEDTRPVTVQFAFGAHEDKTHAEDCVQKLRELGFHATKRLKRERSSCIVGVSDSFFAQFIKDNCSTLSWNKRLSPEVMSWDKSLLYEILHGAFLGDGSYVTQELGNARVITTVSAVMARQLRDILGMCGYRAQIGFRPGRQKNNISELNRKPNHTCVTRPVYTVQWVHENREQNLLLQDSEHIVYKLKTKKINQYEGTVYNLEVAEDNSYSTACYVVHNCDPDEFGMMLNGLGNRYNNAWQIVESNNHGNTVISTLLRLGYKKLYVETRERPPNKPTKEYGITTMGGRDGGMRMDMFDALLASWRDKRHGIRSKRTFKEFLTIIKDAKGKFQAQSGKHDDATITECIAKYAIPLLPLPYSARASRIGAASSSRATSANTAVSAEGYY